MIVLEKNVISEVKFWWRYDFVLENEVPLTKNILCLINHVLWCIYARNLLKRNPLLLGHMAGLDGQLCQGFMVHHTEHVLGYF